MNPTHHNEDGGKARNESQRLTAHSRRLSAQNGENVLATLFGAASREPQAEGDQR